MSRFYCQNYIHINIIFKRTITLSCKVTLVDALSSIGITASNVVNKVSEYTKSTELCENEVEKGSTTSNNDIYSGGSFTVKYKGNIVSVYRGGNDLHSGQMMLE